MNDWTRGQLAHVAHEYKGNHLKFVTIYRDGYICTAYERTSYYEGTEGR